MGIIDIFLLFLLYITLFGRAFILDTIRGQSLIFKKQKCYILKTTDPIFENTVISLRMYVFCFSYLAKMRQVRDKFALVVNDYGTNSIFDLFIWNALFLSVCAYPMKRLIAPFCTRKPTRSD